MLARLRKSMEEKDGGFTLIELLVVIIIIGILAAIAIPIFLNQRKKAVASSLKEDVRTVATAQETFFVDNQSYEAVTAAPTSLTLSDGTVINLSPGNTVGVTLIGTDGFCVAANNPDADPTDFYWNSTTGGLTDAPC